MNMVTFSNLNNTKIAGRLGNNLFQVAATIGTATRLGYDYGFGEWKYAPYFKPLPKVASAEYTVYREPHFHYSEINVSDNTDLYGFFQSKMYWQHCEDLIRDQFTFTNPPRLSIKNAVSVHVRRGDYVSQAQHHPPLPMSYYKAAMEHFKGYTFLIFSDDIEWCKKEDWFGHEVIFISTFTDVEDLALMSQCSGAIIANSSFSWWGAYLGKEKEVIAPKQWFGSALPHNTKDLYLENWILI